jgi:3-dehydroquinate synthase
VVGTFHQPRLVLTSPDFLGTLPEEHFANGLAEVIKAAIIGDPILFGLLETEADRIWRRDPAMLEEVIARSVAVKARIVERDEREEGLRQVLNLGHTLGHAFEAATGFSRPLHGEAVALGMLAACRLSAALGIAGEEVAGAVEAALSRHRLPTSWAGVSWEDLQPWLGRDKKARENGLTFVLVGGIGDVRIREQVPEFDVRQAALSVLG